MRHPYANYFCQLLYLKLDLPEQIGIIKIILSGFTQILKNTISFNALTSILENGLHSECEKLITVYLKSLKEEFNKTSKLIRVLESLINGFDSQNIIFIVEYIEENFLSLVKMRPGFFLLRKLLKTTKDEYMQYRIMKQIDQNASEFVSTVNGSLLSQCIIRNFCFIKCSNNMKLGFSDKLENNLKKILDSLKATKDKNQKESQEYSENEEVDDLGEAGKNYDHGPLCFFYEILLNKVLFTCLNKHSSKILETALRFGGKGFHQKLLDRLILTNQALEQPHKNSNMISLISSERGLKFIRAALELMIEKNKEKLFSKLCECSEFVTSNQRKEYNELVESYKKSNIKAYNYQANKIRNYNQAQEVQKAKVSTEAKWNEPNNKVKKSYNTNSYYTNTTASQNYNQYQQSSRYNPQKFKNDKYNKNRMNETQEHSSKRELGQNQNYNNQPVKSVHSNQPPYNFNYEYSGKPAKFDVNMNNFKENSYDYDKFVYGEYSSNMRYPYLNYQVTPNYSSNCMFEKQISGNQSNPSRYINSRFQFAQEINDIERQHEVEKNKIKHKKY